MGVNFDRLLLLFFIFIYLFFHLEEVNIFLLVNRGVEMERRRGCVVQVRKQLFEADYLANLTTGSCCRIRMNLPLFSALLCSL